MRASTQAWQGKPRRAVRRCLAVAALLSGAAWATHPALAQSPRDQTIVAGEYFINHDPGEGLGSAISTTYGLATADAQLHLTLAVNDVVYVRFKSSNNTWSAARSIKYSDPLPNSGASLVYAEYFVNTDPGVGSATPVPIGAAGRIELPQAIALTRNDRVYIRVRDSFGRWSAPTGKKYQFKGLLSAQYRLHMKDGSFTSWTALPNPAAVVAQPAFFETTSPPVGGVNVDDVAEAQVQFRSEDYLWGSELVAPGAPSGLSAASASPSEIGLSWADNSTTELGFEVQRRAGSSSTWSHLATVEAGISSYQDNGLQPLSLYAYRVRAFAQGQSEWSNEASATTLAAPPQADFSWSPPVPVVGQIVQLTDASNASPTSWSWDFGDGTGSAQQNPSHAYATAGDKTVRLIASNASGSGSKQQTVTIICAEPGITSEPLSQSINAGQTATLSVSAIGTAPLSYQWYAGSSGNTSSPAGSSASAFTTPPLFTSTSYWVRVSNSCGHGDSNTATASVPSNRVVDVLSSNGISGGIATIPVELLAQGDENSIRFSLTFDRLVLTDPEVSLGSGAGGATLTSDTSQLPSGRLGITVALPPGQTFAAKARQLVLVSFSIAAGTSATSTAIGFGDQPTARAALGASANALATLWAGGTVTISQGYLAGTVVVPLLGHNPGLRGSNWRGDLELWNVSTETVSGALYATERGASFSPSTNPTMPISLLAGEALLLVDVYGQLRPGAEGAGAFRLVMDTDPATGQPYPAPLLRGRFYNLSGAGTEFGMSEPGLDPQQYFGVGTRLGAVMDKDGNRDGIFIVTGSAGVTIHWKHTDASGTVLFDATRSYGRDQTRQYTGGVRDLLTYDPAPGSTLEATITAGTGRIFFLYINNQTNDPAMQEMRPLTNP